MFGYVRAREDTLPSGAYERYGAVYCGLCRRMGERYGLFSRCFLNYDFAFLAMLLAPGDTEEPSRCRRCPRHPLRGRPACPGGAWLSVAAGESVILTVWKLRDTAADGGPMARLGAGLLGFMLKRGYRRARMEYPAFDDTAERLLSELRELEGEGCSSLDRTADCFARLLAAAAPRECPESERRAKEQLLYHLGRWIYLIDAADDLEEDRRAGRYNPVLARFPRWEEQDRAYLRQMLDHSLALTGAAFQLLEPNPWHDVLENILYSGLPTVEELVFSGQWQAYQKRHRRVDG